jgi:hypothetical protein
MIPVTKYDFAVAVDRCRLWIEASLKRSQFEGIETHDFEDVKAMLVNGEAELWSTANGCVITFISHFPKASMLTLWLAGGLFEEVMDEHEESIMRWGRQNKCSSMYVMGRKGWKRKLRAREFIEHATVVSKLL